MDAPRRAAHIYSIDALRGYASLMVCMFHLSAAGAFFEAGWLREIFQHGAVGVPIFFVISGFVIPYSLDSGNYRVSQIGRFLLKRLARLEPPYLASLLVAIALWFLFKFSAGPRLSIDFENVGLHFGYLIDLGKFAGLDVEWYVPIYWTLAYEIQYYATIALLFPLLKSESRPLRLIVLLSFLGLQTLFQRVPAIGALPLFFREADLFVLGILLFHKRARVIGPVEFLLLFAITLASVGTRHQAFLVYGPLVAALVLAIDINTRVTRFLGEISYSLYLFHDTFGSWFRGALMTVLKFGPVPSFLLATCGSIFFAYVMYRLVERPAIRWARTIRYT